MSAALMIDRYSIIKKYREAGLTEDQAELYTEALVLAVSDQVATKQDLRDVESALKQDLRETELALKQDIAAVRNELKQDLRETELALKQDIAAVRNELKQDVAAVRTELKQDIANVRNELKQDITTVKLEIAEVKTLIVDESRKTLLRMVGLAGVIFSAIKLFG